MNLTRMISLRKEYKYTQKYIAEKLGISQSQYFKIENGINKITLDKLKKLATLYNTSIDYLLYRTDVKYPYPESKKNIQD